MIRHIFLFTMINGDAARLSTTDPEEARKLRNNQWATGAAYYYTPWMDPLYDDADKVIPGGTQTRINLVHTTAVCTYEIEDEN